MPVSEPYTLWHSGTQLCFFCHAERRVLNKWYTWFNVLGIPFSTRGTHLLNGWHRHGIKAKPAKHNGMINFQMKVYQSSHTSFALNTMTDPG